MKTKPKRNQPETPNIQQGRDLFQTPSYATNLLIPFIPKGIKIIWECAAGQGKIVCALRANNLEVMPTDINQTFARVNFLEEQISFDFDAIITNPPFSLKKRFYERCISYRKPFALLIPADYSQWVICAIQNGCEKIIPTRRIDYITPSGNGSGAQFHSMWLTYGFGIGRSETFVELTKEMKKDI